MQYNIDNLEIETTVCHNCHDALQKIYSAEDLGLLSDSAIEKRKSILKDFFFISKGTDEELVLEARKMGFIKL